MTERKLPRRVYSDESDRAAHPEVFAEWDRLVRKHDARLLQDGESPIDYPDQAVAYETRNAGWVLSRPQKTVGEDGRETTGRVVLERY